MKTPVIFRAEKSDGDVTAVFPTLPGTMDPSTFQVYQHIGQHGSGSFGWYRSTRPATEEESASLLCELQSIGYDLKPVKRFTKWHDAERKENLK